MKPVVKASLWCMIFINACMLGCITKSIAQNNHNDVHNHVYFRSFWTPLYHGAPVNYCSSTGRDCGHKIAQDYCQIMGYQQTDHWIRSYHLPKTTYLDNGRHCMQRECDGFKTIRCVGRLHSKKNVLYAYRKMRFMVPRFNGFRVDWCYNGQNLLHHEACGRMPAQSFCLRLGYMKTIGFKSMQNLGITQAIGNQKRCDNLHCIGFSYIDCYR